MCGVENEGEEGLPSPGRWGRGQKGTKIPTSVQCSQVLSSWSSHTPFYKKGIRGLESEIRERVQAAELEMVKCVFQPSWFGEANKALLRTSAIHRASERCWVGGRHEGLPCGLLSLAGAPRIYLVQGHSLHLAPEPVRRIKA